MMESTFQALNNGGMQLDRTLLRPLEQVSDIPVKVAQQLAAPFIN